MDKIFGTYSERELKRIYPIRDKVLALDEQYSKMSDQELKAMTPKFKERLANGETLDDILPEASLRALSHYSGNTYLLYKYIHPVSPPLYRFFCSAHSALYMYGYHTFSDSILFHLQLFPFCIFPSKTTKTEPHLYPWVSVLYTPCFL